MTLCVKNWEKFQHYKHRSPPWIRLYKELLDDFVFQRLPDASRALAPMLWLLASESEQGELTSDIDELAFRLRSTPAQIGEALKPLIDKGYFSIKQSASTALASCNSNATTEESRDRDRDRVETEKNLSVLCKLPAEGSPGGNVVDFEKIKLPACPHLEILALWAEVLPELAQPNPSLWQGTRADHLRARWRDSASKNEWASQADGLADLRGLFERVKSSDFLMGRVPSRDKDKPSFRVDLDWIFRPNNWVKLLEGKYDNRKRKQG